MKRHFFSKFSQNSGGYFLQILTNVFGIYHFVQNQNSVNYRKLVIQNFIIQEYPFRSFKKCLWTKIHGYKHLSCCFKNFTTDIFINIGIFNQANSFFNFSTVSQDMLNIIKLDVIVQVLYVILGFTFILIILFLQSSIMFKFFM